jgi:hypothetical protein
MGEQVENDYGHRDDTNTAELTPYPVRDYDFKGRANYPQHVVNRQGDNPMAEQADNDYGHRNDTKSAELTGYGVRDYDFAGRANYPQNWINRQGDNPMVDETIEECPCDENPELDALHLMLSKVGVSDEMIASNQVQLTPSGKEKLKAKLGDVNFDVLLGQLADKIGQQDATRADDYYASVPPPIEGVGEDHDEDDEIGHSADCPACHGPGEHVGALGKADHFRCRDCGMMFHHERDLDEAPFDFDNAGNTVPGGANPLDSPNPAPEQPGRYSYESDYMGNVKVRDSQSGKSIYLQGSEGQNLISELEGAEPDQARVQQLLSRYASKMQPEPRMDGMGESIEEGVPEQPWAVYHFNPSTGEKVAFVGQSHDMSEADAKNAAYNINVGAARSGATRTSGWTVKAFPKNVEEGEGMTNFIDAFNGNESVEEGEMGELIGSRPERPLDEGGTDYIMATLERPVPGGDDEWDDRPVKVYYEYDEGSRGARGEFGRPMEPDEPPSCSVWKVIDAETGQEYVIDEKEREYLEDKCMHEISDQF